MSTRQQCIDAFIQGRIEMEQAKSNLPLNDPRVKEKYEFLTHDILTMQEDLSEIYSDLQDTPFIRNSWSDQGKKLETADRYKKKRINMAKRNTRRIYMNTIKSIDLRNNLFKMAMEMEPEIGNKIREMELLFESEPNANSKVQIRKDIDAQKSILKQKLPKAMSAMLVGTEENIAGGKASLDANITSLERRYFGSMVRELREAGVEDIFFSDTISREIARELENMTFRNKKTGKIEVNPEKITNSREARKIADIIYKYQDDMLVRINRAGNYIKRMPGYIVKQTHDIFALRKAGKDDWISFVRDSDILNKEKTFYGQEEMTDEEVTKALGSIYDNIVSGNYRYGDFKSRAPHRELHFKNADAFMDYNDKFGSGSLIASIQTSMRRGAREIGLTEMFGPDPKSVLDGFFEQMFEYSSDPGVGKVWNERVRRKILSEFKEFDGTTRTPADNILSGWGRGVRAWMNVTKLGGAVLSAFGDIPIFSSEVRHQGDTLLNGYKVAFENLAKGKGSGTRREIADMVGVGFEGMLGAVLSRFSPIDALPKWMNTAQQKFFKYSGLEWWTDAHKTGMANMMAYRMGQMKDLAFDKIDPDMNRLFKNYNIDSVKWDLIRKTAIETEDGKIFITPEGIRDKKLLTDDDIYNALPEWRKKGGKGIGVAIDDYRDRLETELRSYFIDRINYAVITPGAKQSALINQGTPPGTVFHEVSKFFWQFKSFPLTVTQKVIGRELKGKGKSDVGGLIHLLIGTTVLGYGAMTAKDLFKGRKPRDFTEKPGAVFMAAMLQGGGLGIFGDFLFQGQTRYGQSKLESFMGPTYGAVSQILTFFIEDSIKLMKGEKDLDAYTNKALNIARQNIPFINMWYSKWAIDYMLLYAIQEELNPGSFNRMNRRLKKNMGTESYLQPGLGLY